MFAMRPATASDAEPVRKMILARSAWLEERGWPSWRDNADDVASQAATGNMWILATVDGRVAGCTTVLDSAPRFGWTEEEFAQPADYLYTTCTDPEFRGRQPGTLIAYWAVDRAAARGCTAVRRGCFFEGLVTLYRRQGFEVVHEVQRTSKIVYLMQREAEPIPQLGLTLAAQE